MAIIIGLNSSKKSTAIYDQWYGVEGDFKSLDYKLTRIGNLDLHKSLPIQGKIRRYVENTDGSVKYYLHQNDSRLTENGLSAITDGSDGNVMLEDPFYYFKIEFEGTKWRYKISEYPLPGFIAKPRGAISPWFGTIDTVKNSAISGCFLTWNGDAIARDSNGFVILNSNAANCRGGLGASDASWDGTYHSMLGMPRTNVSKAGVRPLCKNGNHIGSYRAYNSIAWLQRIEYASFFCQNTYTATLDSNGYHQGGLGDGSTTANGTYWNTWGGYKPFIPCGVTATLGNNTGQVQYTVKNWNSADWITTVSSYRGLEAPFNYLWMLADDLLINYSPDTANAKTVAYLCEDPTKFVSPADGDVNIPDGYNALCNLPRADGYIKTLNITDKGYALPATVGAASNTGVTDYMYQAGTSASGWYGALLSAYALNGATAGFGCLAATYRSSYANAYVGFRLCRF